MIRQAELLITLFAALGVLVLGVAILRFERDVSDQSVVRSCVRYPVGI